MGCVPTEHVAAHTLLQVHFCTPQVNSPPCYSIALYVFAKGGKRRKNIGVIYTDCPGNAIPEVAYILIAEGDCDLQCQEFMSWRH